MVETVKPALLVTELLAEHEARRRQEREAEEQLKTEKLGRTGRF